MTPEERRKALATAAAEVTRNPLVPSWARLALAAAAEEFAELRKRLDALEPCCPSCGRKPEQRAECTAEGCARGN